MSKKITSAVALLATCLSLVSAAQAGTKSTGGGFGGVSTMDLGSGR